MSSIANVWWKHRSKQIASFPVAVVVSCEDLSHGRMLADASAARTALPYVVRISGLPVANGKAGSPFPVGEIPIIVVRSPK